MSLCAITRALPGTAVERLGRVHEVRLWPGEMPPSSDELVALAHDADALIALVTDTVDAAVFDACPRLRAVANYAVGFDNIAVAEAAARGIAVGNTPDVLTDATADLAFALLAAAARQIAQADRYVREGRWRTWSPQLFLGKPLKGARLGIVGPGRIGRGVADRAEGYGMDVTVFDQGDPAGTFERLLAESDFVSLHCPLTPETRHIIDEGTLALMKPDAILVNTARGGLVDLVAVAAALGEGRLGGAALDVTDPEPLPLDHPILTAPHLTLAPHIGSATRQAREAMADLAVDNILAALAGCAMPHPVAVA
ncbi:MAG: D-glycerate dehydrogenase [Bifidobacteriaceae bacterium]|nr:D-glycerate dehydrogenase [Bifidobacteriaceae bacterium]